MKLLRPLRSHPATGDTARQVTGDLDQVRTKAQALGAISTGDRLGRDLRGLSGHAQAAQRELAGLNAMAAKLGVENGTGRLEGGLKRLEAPAAEAARRIEGAHQAAVKLGAGNPTGRLASGLDAVSGAGERAGRGIEGAARAAARLGAAEAGGRLAAGLAAAETAAQRTSRAVEGVSQAAVKFGAASASRELTRELGATTRAADTARREMAELTLTVDRLGQGRSVRILERDLSDAGRAAGGLQRRMEDLHRRHGAAAGGASRPERFAFANEALMASGLGGAARLGMGGAAAGGLAAGGAIAATAMATARATREAVTFETAMTEVRKATAGTTEEMAEIERRIMTLSRQSGVAKTEIAGLIAQAGYFNIPREDLPDFADLATKSAVAFRMPAPEAGEKLGQLSNAYNFNPASRRLAADAINTIGDTAGTSERNVINFASRISGVAQMYKLPFAKGAAFGGGVMGMGVEPEVAATGFTALLTKLGTADQSTDKDFHRGLGRIGLNGRRVKAMVNQDPELALRDVLERINKLPQAKKPGVVADIAGVEHGPAIARMAESLPKIVAALERVRDASAYSGSLERTFKIFSSDTQAALNRADASLGALTAKIGQRFTPAVKEAANVTARWLGGMVKAMELADRASALSAKQLKGEALTKSEQDELSANPLLKAETDRRVTSGREDVERRAIVEEEGRRLGARPRDPAAAARAARPRQPDEQDAVAAEARERTRQRMGAEIKGLSADIETRRSGGFETTADRRRLRALQRQYDR